MSEPSLSVPGAETFRVRVQCGAPAPLVVNGGAYAGCTEEQGHDLDTVPHSFTIHWSAR